MAGTCKDTSKTNPRTNALADKKVSRHTANGIGEAQGAIGNGQADAVFIAFGPRAMLHIMVSHG